MIDNSCTRPPEPCPLADLAPTPAPDLIGLLWRAYHQAGLPMEASRRCALADFQCSFPQYLIVP